MPSYVACWQPEALAPGASSGPLNLSYQQLLHSRLRFRFQQDALQQQLPAQPNGHFR